VEDCLGFLFRMIGESCCEYSEERITEFCDSGAVVVICNGQSVAEFFDGRMQRSYLLFLLVYKWFWLLWA